MSPSRLSRASTPSRRAMSASLAICVTVEELSNVAPLMAFMMLGTIRPRSAFSRLDKPDPTAPKKTSTNDDGPMRGPKLLPSMSVDTMIDRKAMASPPMIAMSICRYLPRP